MKKLFSFSIAIMLQLTVMHAEAQTFSARGKIFPDSVTVIAAPRYRAGPFKKWLLGDNYRPEWISPVRVPVLDITTLYGGLKPVKQGGGMQSRSLRLEDSSGREYALRSVEKYPDKTLPENLRETFIKDAVVDGISASYPFAALSVPPLAAAAGIPHLVPKLYYVPDDTALGIYQKTFANGLFLLEPREPEGVSKTWNSEHLLEELLEDNENRVNQREVLLARTLDMFIMDFDRHEDQWRWGRNKTSDETIYYPIPRDRDQPFFINNGFLPGIISRNWLQPKFQGFRSRARDIRTFNFNARFFDRLYLNEPDEATWKVTVDEFLKRMTDSVIDAAIQEQPGEIRMLHGMDIGSKLKQRRKHLSDEMLAYYRFLSKIITLTGSDEREWFELEWQQDGQLLVQMFNINKQGQQSRKLYERKIDPDLTSELRLYGMNGDDIFHLEGESTHGPLVRIISGKGKDSLISDKLVARPKNIRWYDHLAEANFSDLGKEFRRNFSTDTTIHAYSPRSFRYNVTAPLLSVAFNPDDGIFLGAGFRRIRHGFRKEPYAIRQILTGNHALGSGAYSFRYQLDAVDIIPVPFSSHRKLDLRVAANLKAPNYVQNFFGYGNETLFPDTGSKKISYYRSRFNLAEFGALLNANPGKSFSLLLGPVLQHYRIDEDDNKGKYLDDPNGGLDPSSGLDPERLFSRKTYVGIQLQTNLDTRNHEAMPGRGIKWTNVVNWADGLGRNAFSFSQLNTDLSIYTTLHKKSELVLAGRVGGGINEGKPEFFQSQFLGGSENLRGFRKYRFAGKKMLYNNFDLRLKLAYIKGYILPGTLGILAFHDIGRVWVKGENSDKWHRGYGAGVWLAPAGAFVVTANYAWSDDGGIPFISLGYQF